MMEAICFESDPKVQNLKAYKFLRNIDARIDVIYYSEIETVYSIYSIYRIDIKE